MHLRSAPNTNIKHSLLWDVTVLGEGTLNDADRNDRPPENNGGISAAVTYFLQKSQRMCAEETY